MLEQKIQPTYGSGYVRFTRIVKDLAIIILDYVQPLALPHVQIRLIHDVSQTLVVHVYVTTDPVEVMYLVLGSEHYRSQLEIVCGISRLMRL